jgi:hypothetical protein
MQRTPGTTHLQPSTSTPAPRGHANKTGTVRRTAPARGSHRRAYSSAMHERETKGKAGVALSQSFSCLLFVDYEFSLKLMNWR